LAQILTWQVNIYHRHAGLDPASGYLQIPAFAGMTTCGGYLVAGLISKQKSWKSIKSISSFFKNILKFFYI